MDELSTERIAELAWLAGLVDGEGWIGAERKVHRKKRVDGSTVSWIGFQPSVVIHMGSQLACEAAQRITGVGKVFLYGLSVSGREMWKWRCRNKDALAALNLLRPFLLVKARQAELVLRIGEINGDYHKTRRWRARSPELAGELGTIMGEIHSLQSYKGRSKLVN